MQIFTRLITSLSHNITSRKLWKLYGLLHSTSSYYKNFFSPSIRMSEKSIKFEDEKVNKRSFYKNKKPFKVEDIDINKILVSKKELFEKKLNVSLDIMTTVVCKTSQNGWVC